ncbi:MAG: trigger factor [Clostridiales bacterium]|nr:trigger factor [Clostridiales bacterium]
MSLKSSKKIETNTYELEVSISAEDFNAEVLKVYNKKKNKMNVPGWRRGKAPLHIIQLAYGEGVFYEDALDNLYPATVTDAINEAGIDAVDSPYDVDIKEIGKNGVEMTMKVTVKPEITVTAYKGLEACKHSTEATEDEINSEIERMRERNASIEPVEREVHDGDIVVIDYEGSVDGVPFPGGKAENSELEIGSGHFIPGFEEKLIGHKRNEEFDIDVTFPEEYEPSLAGKDAVFKIKINEIKQKILPEVNDDFAKDVSEDADTVEQLKNNIKEEIEADKKRHVESEFENELLAKLAENVVGEIPDCMFKNKADDNKRNFENRLAQQKIDIDTYLMYFGMEKEKYEEDMMAQAIQQVKVRLGLEKVAELENIEVSDEELDAEYEKMAKNYGVGVDSVKSFFKAEDVKEDVKCEKAIEVIKENAVVCEHHHHDEDEEGKGEEAAEAAADENKD